MGSGKMVQKFLGSGERVFESKILPYSKYYILHPILNSVIYERSTRLDRATYYIHPRVIVGDGYPWKDPRLYETNRYCSFIDRVCSTDRFLDKRGVFLASSYQNIKFIDVLSGYFKKFNLSLEIDKWMKSEEREAGGIFCDAVCPKVFRNLWMIAEVSDFNPNVFFECGFAIGLGRTVTFLIDENAGMIKSKLGKLYLRYKTIDDIINKLEWNRDTFNKIKINSLYRVPKLFKHFDKFSSSNEREKSSLDYVLSFNQETDIIRKLSEYGCKIEGIDRLNSSFMPRDLVAELIDAKAVLVNLSGVQKEQNTNKLNDSQLMCLAGICVSQCVPVKIFQSNDNFYSDVREISIGGNSGKNLIEFVNGLSI